VVVDAEGGGCWQGSGGDRSGVLVADLVAAAASVLRRSEVAMSEALLAGVMSGLRGRDDPIARRS
jgi:hypothetical protein